MFRIVNMADGKVIPNYVLLNNDTSCEKCLCVTMTTGTRHT